MLRTGPEFGQARQQAWPLKITTTAPYGSWFESDGFDMAPVIHKVFGYNYCLK
jgi:hypothetical protein